MYKQAKAVTFFNRDSYGRRSRGGTLDDFLEKGYTVVSSQAVDDWVEYIVQKEIKEDD